MKNFLILCICHFAIVALAVDESPLNLLRNPGFEDGTASWVIPEWASGVEPETVSSGAVEGSHALKFELKPGEKINFMQTVKPGQKTDTFKLSAWVNTDNAENLKMELAAELICHVKGKTVKKNIKTVSTTRTGWQKLEKSFNAEPGLRQIRIYLFSRSSSNTKKASGVVLLDCVQLEGIPATGDTVEIRGFHPGGLGGVYLNHQDIELKLALINPSDQDKVVTVETMVADYYNREIHREKKELSVAKLNGTFHKIRLKAPGSNGFYSAIAKLYAGRTSQSEMKATFVIVREQKKNDEFFGINPIGFPLSEVGTAQRIGSGRAGIRFLWSTEGTPGKIRWDETDKRVDEYIRCGLQIVGMFPISGNHYSQPEWIRRKIGERIKTGKPFYDEEYYAAADNYIRQTLKRYGTRVHDWVVSSEIDLGMHRDPWEKEHYARRVEDISRAVRELCPDASFGGIGVSGVDGQSNPRFPAAEELWKRLHSSLDLMAYDPYVDPKTFGPGHHPVGPERGNLRGILLESLALVRKYGKDAIAIDEKGYKIVSALPPDSVYAKKLAEVLARGYVLAKSVKENRYWLYFMFSDRHKEGLGDYGLWKGTNPRPAVAAYASTARHLAFSSDPVMVNIHKDIFCVVFSKGEKSLAAIWSITDEPVRFSCRLPGKFQVYDLMDNKVGYGDGTLELQLGPSLFFVESESSAESTVAGLSQSRFTLPEIKGSLYMRNLSQLTLLLSNQTEQNLDIDVRLTKPTVKDGGIGKLRLGARQSIEKQVAIPSGIPAITDKDYCAGYEVEAKTASGHTYRFAKDIRAIPVARIGIPVKIDGSLDEYEKMKALELNDPSWLFPVDALPNRLWTGPEDLSCKVFLAYDEQYLYLAFKVRDDVMSYSKTGQELWMNDSIQFAFDPGSNATASESTGQHGYDKEDCEFAMSMTPAGPEIFCYKASHENIDIQNKTRAFPLAIKREGTDTIYEVAIPWSALSPLKPIPGNTFGFNFALFDSDEKGKSPLYWFSLTPGIAGGKKPEAFKTFFLMP